MRRSAVLRGTVTLLVGSVALGGCGSAKTISGSGDNSPTTNSSEPSSAARKIVPPSPEHRGGTIIRLAKTNGGTADPHINYTQQYWWLYPMTYDGLTANPKFGDDLNQVVPDIAEEIPKPQDSGRTFVFKIRKGIRFSNGQELTPDDVKASFERIFKVKGPTATSFYGGIVGAKQCLKAPASCNLDKGVVADTANSTITLHLVAPDAEIMQKLALPHAAILPKSTPGKDLGTQVSQLHGTGAYYWASYDPTGGIVLKRNPYFKEWNAIAQPTGNPDVIEEKYGLEPTDQVTQVLNGTADLMFDPVPPDRLPEISAKYSSQVQLDQQGAVWYWGLNTRIPPFNNVKARQAINLAYDRAAAINTFGGPQFAVPTCQILPPGFPAYVRYCPWTKDPGDGSGGWTAPDMARAKQLAKESGTAGATVSIVPSNDPQQVKMGEYAQTLVKQLGWKPVLKPLDGGLQFPFIQNSGNKVAMGLSQWYQDYVAPSDFLNVLLSCSAFTPNSDSSINIGGFCDPKIDAEMKMAMAKGVTDQTAANEIWTKVDHQITDQAPWITMFSPKNMALHSKRLQNVAYSKTNGIMMNVAWVK